MNTFAGREIKEIPLSLKSERDSLGAFLKKNGLTLGDLDYALGVYDRDGYLVGCGGLEENIIKCVAISPELRSEGVAASLISSLLTHSMEEGNTDTFVFTKPEYTAKFSALSFRRVGEAPKAVLLESNPRELESYIKSLRILAKDKHGRNGVIVMNANPLTKGHLYLVEQASRQVDNLFIIPVADNPATEFSYSERGSMLESATAAMPNVTVCEGSRYVISSATFPTYFIKTPTEIAETHIALDLDIFGRHIASALNATVRFVGTEPSDSLTALYNRLMPGILGRYGVDTVEIPRLESNSVVISASKVRELLHTGLLSETFNLVPEATLPYLLGHAATLALEMELETTPKPGLVDLADCGAHSDMDVATMRRGIAAISPFFVRIAIAAGGMETPDVKLLAEIGREAEDEMLKATDGVNTHKGAFFSLGIAVASASHIMACGNIPDEKSMMETIKLIAEGFNQPAGTHGARVKERYGIPTALDQAKNGYEELFGEWLPYLRRHRGKPYYTTRLLLKIMTRLDDSNIYWRSGRKEACEVKAEAAAILDEFSFQRIEELNRSFTARHISPGGAADMLALTLLVDSILKKS